MRINLNGRDYLVEKASGLSKIRGLMFSKKRNLLFDLDYKKELIHSFYVFFSIKLYFLDEDFKVVEKKKLRPFWFYVPKKRAKYLVEISEF